MKKSCNTVESRYQPFKLIGRPCWMGYIFLIPPNWRITKTKRNEKKKKKEKKKQIRQTVITVSVNNLT